MSQIGEVTGTVELIWDSDGELLITLDPDDPGAPHVFEMTGDLRDRLANQLEEGDRVEVTYEATPHEVVDPDSGPSETLRPTVRDVKIL